MEDYTSARNSYKVDTDDPGVAVRGLSYGELKKLGTIYL